MSSDSYLQGLVIGKCKELGDQAAAEFFSVSPALVRQWVNGSKVPSLAAVERVFSPPSSPFANAEWAGKEIFVAAPFYKTSTPATMFALIALWDRAKMGFRHRSGDAFIAHARNQLAEDYLASGMPLCFSLDDDMIPPCGHAWWYNHITGFNLPERFAGLHAINQLRSRGKSLIGGLYFGRNKNGRALYADAFTSNEENARAHTAPFDEVKAVDWVATGCMLFTREVLLDIKKTHPYLAPQVAGEPFHFFSAASDPVMRAYPEMQQKALAVDAALRGGNAGEAGKLLQELIGQMEQSYDQLSRQARLNQGEDITFCRRAKFAGHQPHVDFSVVCGHIGGAVYGPPNTGAS